MRVHQISPIGAAKSIAGYAARYLLVGTFVAGAGGFAFGIFSFSQGVQYYGPMDKLKTQVLEKENHIAQLDAQIMQYCGKSAEPALSNCRNTLDTKFETSNELEGLQTELEELKEEKDREMNKALFSVPAGALLTIGTLFLWAAGSTSRYMSPTNTPASHVSE